MKMKQLLFISVMVLLIIPNAFALSLEEYSIGNYDLESGSGFLGLDTEIYVLADETLTQLTFYIYSEEESIDEELYYTLSSTEETVTIDELLVGNGITDAYFVEGSTYLFNIYLTGSSGDVVAFFDGTQEIIFDFTAPSLTIDSYPDSYFSGEYYSSFQIDVTASDDVSGIDYVYALFESSTGTVESVELTETSEGNYELSSDDLEFEDGEYSYYLIAVDTAENSITSVDDIGEITLYFDATAPQFTWNMDNPTEFIEYSDDIVFDFQIDDDIDSEVTCDIYLDGSLVGEDDYTTGEALSFPETGSASIDLGNYELYLVCTDDAGNDGTSEVLLFSVVDATEPTVIIDYPTDGQEFNEDYVSSADYLTVLVSAYDETELSSLVLVSTDSDGVSTSFGELEVLNAEDYTYELLVTLSDLGSEGYYTLTVTGTDSSGNTGEDSVEILYDITAPVITVGQEDGKNYEYDNISLDFEINESVEDDYVKCALYVDESMVDSDTEVTDSVSFDLTSSSVGTIGTYGYYLLCVDVAENFEVSEVYSFSVVDTTAPTVEITSVDEEYDTDSTLVVEFSISEDYELDSYAAVLIDESLSETDLTFDITDNGDATYSLSYGLSLDDGMYELVIMGIDTSGNEGSDSTTIYIDTEDPVITVGSEGYVFGNFEEAIVDFVIVDDLSSEFSCGLYIQLTNVFEITSGTVESTAELSFVQDEWEFSMGSSPTEGEEYSSFLYCEDQAENFVISDTFTITFVDGAPDVEITSPEDADEFSEADLEDSSLIITLVAEVSDLFGSVSEVTFVISNDNGEVEDVTADITEDAGTYFVNLDVSDYDDGEYIFTVTGTDDLGQENTDSVTFVIDTTAPEMISIDLTDGDLVTGEFIINVVVEDENSYAAGINVVNFDGSEEYYSLTNTNSSETEFELTVDSTEFSNEEAETTISFILVDALGNENDLGDYTLVLVADNTAPSIDEFTCSDITTSGTQDCTCEATDGSEAYGGIVSTEIESADTSSAGEITLSCTATDSSGNEVSEETTFTVSVPATASSGGGGGGGTKSECADGKDNDGDGLSDLDDPGCSSRNDDDETDPVIVTCTENWVCLDWNTCSDGEQTRSCYDANACEFNYARGQVDVVVTAAMPDESRECTVEAITSSVDETEIEESEVEEIENDESDTQEKGFINSLTGAFAGVALSDNLKELAKPAGIILALVVLTGLAVVGRKKFKK